MEFFLHKDFSEFSETTWNALVESSIADTPFSRYEYLCEWWKTLGGGEWKSAELVLVSATENDQLIGIAPLFITEYDGQRALISFCRKHRNILCVRIRFEQVIAKLFIKLINIIGRSSIIRIH